MERVASLPAASNSRSSSHRQQQWARCGSSSSSQRRQPVRAATEAAFDARALLPLRRSPLLAAPSLGRAPSAAPALHADRLSAAVEAPLASVAGEFRRSGGGALPRLRVAVDVDEVLGRFVFALNAFVKAEFGMCYDVSDYSVYEYAKVWGVSPERASAIVHDFFRSRSFAVDGIPPIPEARASLQRLAAWCELVVVTSRQHVIQDATLDWIDRHYPGLFQEVYFGNHFALSGASRKKSDICASVGAQVLVDDNVGYALDCAASGMRVLLFDWQGAYPWSKPPPGSEHPNIQVVRSWAEVEWALHTLAASSTLNEP